VSGNKGLTSYKLDKQRPRRNEGSSDPKGTVAQWGEKVAPGRSRKEKRAKTEDEKYEKNSMICVEDVFKEERCNGIRSPQVAPFVNKEKKEKGVKKKQLDRNLARSRKAKGGGSISKGDDKFSLTTEENIH